MYHVDNSTGVPVMPQPSPVTSKTELFFTEGGNGVPPTYPGPDWFNAIQSELLNILRAAELEPDKMDTMQILAALKLLFLSRSNPFGDIKTDGPAAIATALSNLGLTYFADRGSLALQDFAGPLSSKDSVTATSPDGTTRKISLNATNGLQIVIYDGGQYRGAINVPTKAGTMALTSDLVNFADKSSAAEQSFTGPVSSGEGLVAKYGAAKIILSAQNGQRIVVYTNDTYRGAINIPLRDGTMALLDDVTNVSATLLGISQSWQNVKANRTAGVTYTNSTSRPIAVSIAGIMASRQTGVQLSLAVNGTEASSFAVTDSSFDIRGNVFAIVPPGATYNLTANNINSILTWSELR